MIVKEIPLEGLHIPKTTFRSNFNGPSFDDLVERIKKEGLTDPITVKGKLVIDGWARVCAARALGWKTILARCLDGSELNNLMKGVR